MVHSILFTEILAQTDNVILSAPLFVACPYPMDVVFALDSSSKLQPSDFKEQKSFVQTMIDGFTISKWQTHVGLITVTEAARKVIELTGSIKRDTLKAAVNRVRFQPNPSASPTNRIRDMLKKALEIFKNGGRSKVSLFENSKGPALLDFAITQF